MSKKGQLAIFIVIALLLVAAIAFRFILKGNSPTLNFECEADSQCVPSECCHATSCVSSEKAPVCDDVFCTTNCAPGTLDCQQASCKCVNSKCQVVPN